MEVKISVMIWPETNGNTVSADNKIIVTMKNIPG